MIFTPSRSALVRLSALGLLASIAIGWPPASGLRAATGGRNGARSVDQSAYGVRSFKSGPIQVTANGRFVWVASQYADSVSRYDTQSGTVASYSLPDPGERDAPRGLSVTEDGSRVWVAAHDSDKLFVLNGENGALVQTITLPWGSGPYSVALAPPDGSGSQPWALVALHRTEALAAVNTKTFDVTILSPVFHSPFGIAFTPDGKTAWVTHLYVNDEHPHFTAVDFSWPLPRVVVRANAFAATPQMAGQLTDPDAAKNVAEGGYLNFRGHPAVLPPSTGKAQLYIPTQYHNMHADRFSPDSTIELSLRKLDFATERINASDKAILTAVQVHDPNRGQNNPPWLGYGWNVQMSGGVDMGFTQIADKLRAVLIGEQSDDLTVFPWDIAPQRSTTDPDAPGLPEVLVGSRPMGLALSPTAPRAYTYNAFSFDISVVDLSDPENPTELQRVKLPGALASEPIADKRLLKGARIFYGSDDPRVSKNSKVACASCHINGEHDGRTWNMNSLPAGTNGQGHGPRNTPSLLGLALTFTNGARDKATGYGELHHSGDRDELQDFDLTFSGPQMGGTGFLGDQAQPELGPPNAGRSADLDAMADFVLSQPALQRSPFRAAGGALSEAAIRGATFFVGSQVDGKPADANCASCHVPETGFTDRAFHDVGGRRANTEQELNGSTHSKCPWCINTPTLVGVWTTPSWEGIQTYADSMLDVLRDFSASGRPAPHGRVQGLTSHQLEDLAVFVQSIDGRLTAAEVRAARDTQPPRIVRVSPTSLNRVEVWFNEAVNGDSAENADSYRLTNQASGANVDIVSADWDGKYGDHVVLRTAPMTASSAGVRYQLRPAGPIRDLADTASGGVANVIDQYAATNQHSFTLTDTLTITLGGSGYENLSIKVHDASPIGPNLATWQFDRVYASTASGTTVPGLVRFDWIEPFMEATGVRSDDNLLKATVYIPAQEGDARRIEARRVLQSWSDIDSGGDYNQNPTGGVTWRDHESPSKPWNQAGAGALGGTGSVESDYNSHYDLAERTDAVFDVPAINAPIPLGGPLVTEAYRFWLEHPDLNYGHAVRVISNRSSQMFVMCSRSEDDLGRNGPVLELTYRLVPGAAVPTEPHPTEPHPTATPTRRPDEPRPTATRTPGDDRPTPTRTPADGGPTPSRTPADGPRPTPTPTRRPEELPTATRTPTPRSDDHPTATLIPGGLPTATHTPRPGTVVPDGSWWRAFLPIAWRQ